MIEKWKKALDKKESAGAVLIDLSKAFVSLNHKLLIAKLHAYCFDEGALKLICNYLRFRKQRTKVNRDAVVKGVEHISTNLKVNI